MNWVVHKVYGRGKLSMIILLVVIAKMALKYQMKTSNITKPS